MIGTGYSGNKKPRTLFSAVTGVNVPFITGQTPGTLQTSDFGGRLGFKFTVGGSNITVTDLGGWIITGSTQDRILSIVNTSNVDVVSATLLIAGTTAGQFNYVSITPTVLNASTSYYMFMQTGTDDWHDQGTVDSNTSVATVIFSAYSNEPTSSIIDNGTGALMFGPVNFKYST